MVEIHKELKVLPFTTFLLAELGFFGAKVKTFRQTAFH
jgi:hypothetical protein